MRGSTCVLIDLEWMEEMSIKKTSPVSPVSLVTFSGKRELEFPQHKSSALSLRFGFVNNRLNHGSEFFNVRNMDLDDSDPFCCAVRKFLSRFDDPETTSVGP